MTKGPICVFLSSRNKKKCCRSSRTESMKMREAEKMSHLQLKMKLAQSAFKRFFEICRLSIWHS